MSEKFEEILTSKHNGQLHQMTDQIKAYGQQKFFTEFYHWLLMSDYYDCAETFAEITTIFFKIK